MNSLSHTHNIEIAILGVSNEEKQQSHITAHMMFVAISEKCVISRIEVSTSDSFSEAKEAIFMFIMYALS